MSLIPIEWKLIGAGVGVLALLSGLGVAAAVIDKHGYDKGVAITTAAFEAKEAAQLAANNAAIAASNTALMKTADQLSMKGLELDAALSRIDQSAAGPGGDTPSLDAGRVRDLGAIR